MAKTSEAHARMLEVLDDWWLACCEFVGSDGATYYHKSLGQSGDIEQFCIDHTSFDPLPVRELTRMIRRYEGKTCLGPIPAMGEIRDFMEVRCVQLVCYLRRDDISFLSPPEPPELNDCEEAICTSIDGLWADGEEWPTLEAIARKAGYSESTVRPILAAMARHKIVDKGPSGQGYRVRT